MRDLKTFDVAIVTHEFFKGSGQELKDFLINKKIERLYYVAHQFYYAKDSLSYLKVYERGKKVKEERSLRFPKSEFILYLRDAFYNLKFFLFKERIDYFIGVNSFNAIFGLLLKKLGKVDKVVFFTIDYVMENRFNLGLLNKLYTAMDRYAFFNSDYTWNVSGRMSRQRIQELGKKAEKKPQLVVPIGIPTHEAAKVNVRKRNNVIVYSGGLSPEFGLELIINSTPHLVERFPNLEVRIIGDGPLKGKLDKMVRDLGIERNVNFIGFINTTTERYRWLELLKESTVGLAPYEETKTTYKRFSDVTKPKDYMACGLPIITTSIIPVSEDVKNYNLGRVVEDNVESFVKNVSELLENERERKLIEKNIYNYSKDMSWENIFKRVFAQMGINC